MVSQLPEPGQLVVARRRQFVVSEVSPSTLAVDPLHNPLGLAQNLVTLSSIDEDALGEELNVIWEIEPGARVHDKLLLPEPDDFDAPATLDAFLDAVRWGAIESSDTRVLHSPFRAGISIIDYQLDPVVRALGMPRVNLLIADDVGLGKTIEAGLVAQELLLRHRVRTILIVVPASLQLKWQEEMRDRFGLEFRIVDAQGMKELRRRRGIHVNPWTHFPRLITSIDFLKRDRSMRLMRQSLPAPGEPIFPRKFDLLIIDEAHNVAPSGVGNYATESERTQAIRTIAPHFEHKLFLTATPHNGYDESFSALLELLDNQRFARDVPPDRDQLDAVMVHRLKSEFNEADGTRRFPERKLEVIEVPYTEEERNAHRKLVKYGELRQKASSEGGSGVATVFILKLLKKRLFSSPRAFLDTLNQHMKTLRGISKGERKKPRAVDSDILKRELEGAEDASADDEETEDLSLGVADTATAYMDRLSVEERLTLQQLRDWAETASGRADTKALCLLEWLGEVVKKEGEWTDERVIIFTEYRSTQKWLYDLFDSHGFSGGGHLEMIYGGMKTEERERIKAAFQAKPSLAPVRILLATDTASEGIDLQNWCNKLIHYEIPWNPNRLEQRMGRIDRYGQKADEVFIYNFVGAGWEDEKKEIGNAGDLSGDLEFLMRAVIKVNAIRERLGKIGPIIADQIEQAMMGKRRTLDTRQQEEETEPLRRILRFERNLRERIAQLHERLMASMDELQVRPQHILAVVSTALEIADQPKLKEKEFEDIWPDPNGIRTECPIFSMPRLTGSWRRCLEGLNHPHTGEERPIVFDQTIAGGRDDVVLIHLNHPLVRMSQQLLRAEVWAPDDTRKLNRLCVRRALSDDVAHPTALIHARLMVTGGNDRRLHEELMVAGGLIREGRFSRLNVGETQAALEAAGDEAVPEAKEWIQGVWPDIRGSLDLAINARKDERLSGISGSLARRAETEVNNLTAVMEELALSIKQELDAEPPPQMDLFDANERASFERNRNSLEVRLAAIPEEIKTETALIEERFSNPQPWCFPVAVTFIMPGGLEGG